jgi:integrase
MAIHKLTSKDIEKIKKTKKDGMHGDGGNLWLQVRHGGTAFSWIFRYTVNGRERSMGLGSLDTFSLHEARARALKYRQQMADGIDPIEARHRTRLDQQMAQAKEIPFRQCAAGWMAVQEVGWSPRHTANIRQRFEMYVFPKIGDLPVQRLDGDSPDAVRLLQGVLTQEIAAFRFGRQNGPFKPLWTGFYKTARYTREQIEGALNWAHAQRYINNPNAASLKGPLGLLLPKGKTFHQIQHHAALPFKEAGQFMADLRAWKSHPQSHAVLLLQLLLLTGVRKEQAALAKWKDIDLEDGSKPDWNAKDIDLEGAIWVCSHHKTKKKTGQDYVVPLSRQAIALFEHMRDRHQQLGIEIKFDGYIFPGRSNGHIEPSVLNKYLRERLKRKDITIHGFRTTFGDWSVERGFDERDSEMALGHVVGGNVRNIYKRNAKRIVPRRQMLQAWADYLDQAQPLPASITSLGQFKAAKKQDQA